jgi:membrane protein insertase Oxa1/YidC/SpoIIIJ
MTAEFGVLHHLIIGPVYTIYAGVFDIALVLTESVGGAILVFSLAVNVLLGPLYRLMEDAGRAAASVRAAAQADVDRLKRYYRGRELYYYTRTVHRQYGYRPWRAALGSGELGLQVIAFFTAYQFLSGLPFLSRATFLGIQDLAMPDGLVAGFNVLPVVMTLANIGSLALYSRSRRHFVSGLALAGLFLALLYGSPAGVVLYWTCNNLVSLTRNAARALQARCQRGEGLGGAI